MGPSNSEQWARGRGRNSFLVFSSENLSLVDFLNSQCWGYVSGCAFVGVPFFFLVSFFNNSHFFFRVFFGSFSKRLARACSFEKGAPRQDGKRQQRKEKDWGVVLGIKQTWWWREEKSGCMVISIHGWLWPAACSHGGIAYFLGQ